MNPPRRKASGPNPWSEYRVGAIGETTCRTFAEVSHVSHVEPALKVIEEGAIRKGLVFDDSLLNTERTLVTWLSPNSWSDGFRYGNVRFTFNFEELVEDKNYYWVEAITAYSPAACRILVTSKTYPSLTPYDPTKDDGPWVVDKSTGEHYFNGSLCLEFMLEDDLSIRKATEVDFVTHHDRFCSVHRYSAKSCGELGLSANKGGAQLLAAAGARGVVLSAVKRALIEDSDGLTYRVRESCAWIAYRFRRVKFSGRVDSSDKEATALGRGALNALAIDLDDEAEALASLFKSDDDFFEAVAEILAASLDWDDVGQIKKALVDL